jgi:predicted nucleotidyltransferase
MVKAKSALESQRKMGELVKEVVEKVTGEFPLLEVYVFGSRARGNYLDTSDLDLALVFQKLDATKIELLEKVSKYVRGPVDIVVMSSEEAARSRLIRDAKKVWDSKKGFDLSIFQAES